MDDASPWPGDEDRGPPPDPAPRSAPIWLLGLAVLLLVGALLLG